MFKVGDKVKLKKQYNTMYGFANKILIVSKLSHDNEDHYIHFKINGNDYGGYFDFRFELVEPITPIDKQAAVIAKIKYLNKRFDMRKQHAALG